MHGRALLIAALVLLASAIASARVTNIKVVSDNRPDLTDLPSYIHSITAPYKTVDEQCRAIWRWQTRMRRQTPHPYLHGTPPHDPIMFFNDFGHSYCSDYAGINCAIWNAMGLPVRYWDIALHTVSECFYDGRWHHFDNSMSCYYTLCDGKTVAGVEGVGLTAACEASHGKSEAGHLALVHTVGATSRYGFLSGADTQRPVEKMGQYCFNPNALKHRTYYNSFETGHRYLLHLRNGESYTRHARALGESAQFYYPLEDGGTPQKLGTFGNGVWLFKPDLTRAETLADFDRVTNLAVSPEGLKAKDAAQPAEAIFRVDGANLVVSAGATLDLKLAENAACAAAISTDLGHAWREVCKIDKPFRGTREVPIEGVNGVHQYLIKITLTGAASLKGLEVMTITQVNKLTLPILDLGLNTIDVVAGEPTETIMLWPELQKNKFRETCVSSENVESPGAAEEWHGCLWLEKPGTGNFVYAIEAPEDIIELTYGGRFYNRAPKSSIVLEHSFDEGKTWTKQWEYTDVKEPWDTPHLETIKVPAGVRRILMRYTLNSKVAGEYSGCSLYSIRANATYRPANAKFEPFKVTYNWSEWNDKESKWTGRSHTQLIAQPRQRYTISVGGDDLPRTDSVAVAAADAAPDAKPGYSDGVDLQAKPFIRKRHVWGNDLAVGKKYTFSVLSGNNWDGGDPQMTKLTDERVASTYGGGTTYMDGPIWETKKNPVITLDLESPQNVTAARIHATGYEYDFYNGPFCDIEILTSEDGANYISQGVVQTKMRHKDVDGDFLMPEHGQFDSWTFPLLFKQPVKARYLQYKVSNPGMVFATSEVMAYDSVKIEDWREPLAMPLD